MSGTVTSDTDSLDGEIIRLAYSAVMDPLVFEDFLSVLVQAGDQAVEEAEGDPDLESLDGLRNRVERVSSHIKHAEDLLKSQSSRMMADPGARRTLRDDTRPAILLSSNGKVQSANMAAMDLFDLRDGRPLPSDILESADRVVLKNALRQVGASTRGEVSGRIALRNAQDGTATQFALIPVSGEGGDQTPLLRLSALSVPWRADVAERFKRELHLSNSELAVLKAIVQGETLRSLADRRGRSLGTIRNQLKSIFRKTEVDSQVRLVSLYAAFTELSRHLAPEANNPRTSGGRGGVDETIMLHRSDGSLVQVDMAGPARGRAVLMFNGIISGNVLTSSMRKALFEWNVRLVMPWRPGWAGTTPDAKGSVSTELAVRDIELIVDQLSLGTVPALAEAVGGIHALNYAKRAGAASGASISALVWYAANLPARTASELRDLGMSTRALTYLVRYTPQLASAFIRLVLSRIDAGHDVQAILDLVGGSEDDARILSDPQTVEALYNHLPQMRAQSLKGAVQDVKTEYMRWNHLDTDPGFPLHLMHGRGQLKAGSDWPQALAGRLPSVSSEFVPAGSLFYLEKFDRVLAALDQICPGWANSSTARCSGSAERCR